MQTTPPINLFGLREVKVLPFSIQNNVASLTFPVVDEGLGRAVLVTHNQVDNRDFCGPVESGHHSAGCFIDCQVTLFSGRAGLPECCAAHPSGMVIGPLKHAASFPRSSQSWGFPTHRLKPADGVRYPTVRG